MHPRIISIRPAPAGAGGRTIAFFDAQVADDVRLFNLRLVSMPDGRHLTYPPNALGERAATFSPALATEITRAACAALGAVDANYRHSA